MISDIIASRKVNVDSRCRFFLFSPSMVPGKSTKFSKAQTSLPHDLPLFSQKFVVKVIQKFYNQLSQVKEQKLKARKKKTYRKVAGFWMSNWFNQTSVRCTSKIKKVYILDFPSMRWAQCRQINYSAWVSGMRVSSPGRRETLSVHAVHVPALRIGTRLR